jgi:hypothetical protein
MRAVPVASHGEGSLKTGTRSEIGRLCMIDHQGECLYRRVDLLPRFHVQSLTSTKLGRYGSHFAVAWAIHVGIGRT